MFLSLRGNWMTDKDNKPVFDLQKLIIDEESYLLRDFEDIVESFVKGYGRFIEQGIPGPTVGLAMLGATINLYCMFGMSDDLPELLRSLADKMENESAEH